MHLISTALTRAYMVFVTRSTASSSGSVRLEVLDEETGTVVHQLVPLSTVALHALLFGVPVSTTEHLRALSAFTESALCIQAARRVVTALLTCMPLSSPTAAAVVRLPTMSLSMSESGVACISVHDMIRLMKLVAASEDVFHEGKASTGAAVVVSADGVKRLSVGAPLMGALQVCLGHSAPALCIRSLPCDVLACT